MRAGGRGTVGLAGAAVSCVLVGAAAAMAAAPAGSHSYTGRVLRVVDGDTVTVRIGGHPTTVQLAGLSTGGCFALPAQNALSHLLPRGRAVGLIGEGAKPYDARGRLVAYVYRTGHKASVNRLLLLTGQARLGGTRPRMFAASFARAAKSARAHRQGQWARCSADPVRPLHGNLSLVQRRLAALGYLPKGYVTKGAFDDRTQQALMAFQGWEGLTRTGTLDAATRARLERPAHPTPSRTGSKHVEVHVDKQVLLLVDGSRVRRAIHVSTGAGGRTPIGSFSVYSKQRLSWSRPFSVWMPYASYFYGGYALHEYSYVPGYPASHGCIRMPAAEAPIVYDFVSPGTPVLVTSS
jgi:endonuclease YncB( thermonuclease family)